MLENWAFPLHVGSFARGAGRVAYTVLGLAPVALLIGGYRLWLTRLARRWRRS